MTCVIAIIENKTLFMGSDTRLSDSEGKYIDTDYPKIIIKPINRKENIFIGWCGDIKAGDVLNTFSPPLIGKIDVDSYIRGKFLKAISSKLKELKHQDEEVDLGLLVFIKGYLYEISSNLSVTKITRKYHSIGSGDIAALSCIDILYPYRTLLKLSPGAVIEKTIKSISKTLNTVGEKSVIIKHDF